MGKTKKRNDIVLSFFFYPSHLWLKSEEVFEASSNLVASVLKYLHMTDLQIN